MEADKSEEGVAVVDGGDRVAPESAAVVETKQDPSTAVESKQGPAADGNGSDSDTPQVAKVEEPAPAGGGGGAKAGAAPAATKREYNKATGKWEIEKADHKDGKADGGAGDAASDKKGDAASAGGKKKPGAPAAAPKKPMVGFASLFRFADCCDFFLIILGCVGAIGVGGALPAFSLLFGDLINDINQPDAEVAANGIENIALIFLWVGLGMFGGGFLRVFGLIASSRRQTHKFRIAYLQQTLRQDVGWHDSIEGKEFTSKLADAATKFEAGISVKFGEVRACVGACIAAAGQLVGVGCVLVR